MKVLNTKIFRVEADANAGERLDKNEVHRMMEEAYPEACEIVVKRIRTGVVFKLVWYMIIPKDTRMVTSPQTEKRRLPENL